MGSQQIGEPSYQLLQKQEQCVMNLRPLHDRVIVKRIESETTTAPAS